MTETEAPAEVPEQEQQPEMTPEEIAAVHRQAKQNAKQILAEAYAKEHR
ncbi:hypothetical protein [Methanorbis furvi]